MTDIKKEMDFSQYIWREKDTLIIKWINKCLKSYKNWNIKYTNKKKLNNVNITYKELTMKDLKIWDIFIYKNEIEYIKSNNFNIFIWKDISWNYRYQFLTDVNWMDYITSWGNNNHKEEIIIFNRF